MNNGLLPIDIKFFFNNQILSFLKRYGKTETCRSKGKISLKGATFPSVELARETGLRDFLKFSQKLVTGYRFEIDTVSCLARLYLNFKTVSLANNITVSNIVVSPLTISYEEEIEVFPFEISATINTDGNKSKRVPVLSAGEVFVLDISRLDTLPYMNAVAGRSLELPTVLKAFFETVKKSPKNKLTCELRYSLRQHALEFLCYSDEPIGSEIFSIDRITILSIPEISTLLSLTFSSSLNGQKILSRETVNCCIEKGTFVVSAKVDLPSLNISDLLGEVNVFLEKVPLIERSDWLLTVDLERQSLKIDSPRFQEYLKLSFTGIASLRIGNLVLEAADFKDLQISSDCGIEILGSRSIGGNISFSKNDEEWQAGFMPQPEKQRLAIPLTKAHKNFRLGLIPGEVHFFLSGSEKKKEWHFCADNARLFFNGLPAPFAFLEDKEVSGVIAGDNDSLRITVVDIENRNPLTFGMVLEDLPVINIRKNQKSIQSNSGDFEVVAIESEGVPMAVGHETL